VAALGGRETAEWLSLDDVGSGAVPGIARHGVTRPVRSSRAPGGVRPVDRWCRGCDQEKRERCGSTSPSVRTHEISLLRANPLLAILHEGTRRATTWIID